MIGADIQEHEVVIFDFSRTTHMDDSAALVMEQLIGSAADENTECVVMSLSDSVAKTLNSIGVFEHVPQDRFVGSLDEARALVRRIINDRG